MTVTIFKNFGDKTEPHYISIEVALNRIRRGSKAKKLIDSIRSKVFTGESYGKDKELLPFIVFAAARTKAVVIEKEGKEPYESHRLDESVVEHSGVFALDFDKTDVAQKIEQLKLDPYIYACWISPSGTGVKALVKCPPSLENHDLYYTAFLERYPELDATSRNISRGSFESYDPDIYVNESSLVWDKRITQEEYRRKREKEKNKRPIKILATAVAMVRASHEGNKHESLRSAANLLGGYIAINRVKEEEAIKILEEEIAQKNPRDMETARQTIRDGIEWGKNHPIQEAKKIEKSQQFLRRTDGTYDFLADDDEMEEYEQAVIEGTLPMGLVTGINELNTWWMFKKNHLVWFAGLDNVGKSFFVWYLAVLAAMFHDWRFLVYSSENDDGQVRKKLKEFFLGKSLKTATKEELALAREFVTKHFRIIASTEMHTVDEMLIKAEIIYDEGYEFDCVIAEPYNSFQPMKELDAHRNNLYNLNKMRVFKKQYATIWAGDHVGSDAARSVETDKKSEYYGYVKAPWKSQIDGGQIKASKVDDFIMLHRLANHPFERYITQVHIQKVRDKETGGDVTDKDTPVKLQINMGYCGYTCNGIDPVEQYWKKLKLKPITERIEHELIEKSQVTQNDIATTDEPPF
jgi:hypothetical protein